MKTTRRDKLRDELVDGGWYHIGEIFDDEYFLKLTQYDKRTHCFKNYKHIDNMNETASWIRVRKLSEVDNLGGDSWKSVASLKPNKNVLLRNANKFPGHIAYGYIHSERLTGGRWLFVSGFNCAGDRFNYASVSFELFCVVSGDWEWCEVPS